MDNEETQNNIKLLEKTIERLMQRIYRLENHIHYQDVFGGGATGQPVFPENKAGKVRYRNDEF